MSVKSWFDGLKGWKKAILVIGLIGFYPIGIIFLIVYLISWATNREKSKSALEKLQVYVERKKALKAAKSRLIIHKDEKILYSQFSDFYEERAIRNYVRTGHSVRIMKGWWYHMGSGKSESHGELRKIDSGVLHITSKRFIFNGSFKSYNYNNNKLISVEPFNDSIRIAVDGRQKTLTFSSDNPFLLGYSMQMLQEDSALEEKLSECIELELKLKIAEKINFVGQLRVNINTYGNTAQVFDLLAQAIQLDLEDYIPLLNKTPHEILKLKSKATSLSKMLEDYDAETKTIKARLDSSAKKEEIYAELDKTLDKKYGADAITTSMQDLSNSMRSLEVGKIDLAEKAGKKV